MPTLLQLKIRNPVVCHRNQIHWILLAGSASVSWRACRKMFTEGACLQLLRTHCHWCTGAAQEMQSGFLDASHTDHLLYN